jgi:hypothetical protein
LRHNAPAIIPLHEQIERASDMKELWWVQNATLPRKTGTGNGARIESADSSPDSAIFFVFAHFGRTNLNRQIIKSSRLSTPVT